MLKHTIKKNTLYSLLLLWWIVPMAVMADVVKPALVEIIVNQQGQVKIEIRASIEALLTGINGQYKNTKDAPNADEYDVLRKMQSEALKIELEQFKQKFLAEISLTDNHNKIIALSMDKVEVPEPGYTKVPRISVINLRGEIDPHVDSVSWYYPAAFGDNAVRLKQVDELKEKYHWSEWQWLRKDVASEALSLTEIVARKPLYKTIADYIILGFEHILPKGMDHILFILGLFLFAATFKPLLWQVTMFTVAHTITLGLAMNGFISLPANLVEPLIALSIVYIGFENILSNHLKNSRLVLVFFFGLLHGLGFASVLADFEMPENSFLTALISFNVGVELGQLAIILIAYLLIGFFFNKKAWYKKFITNPISLLITVVAFYWFIQRLDLNF